jgi:hypothetical protein
VTVRRAYSLRLHSAAFALRVLTLLLVLGTRLSFAQVRLIQTNSGSEYIHIIDPATNAIVGEVKGVPVNHGAAASRDGRQLFFSSEAERTLDVVDSKAIASEPGRIDIIDTSIV